MRSADAAQRLERLLGGPALATLRQRLRRIFEQALPGPAPDMLRLDRLAAHEAEALQALSGRAPRASSSVTLHLPDLAAQLQAAGLADNLRHALEQLDGPLSQHRSERAAASQAWAALAAQPVAHPALAAWLDSARGQGLLKRLAGGRAERAAALTANAARVLAALPAAGIPRAQLAARCLGDAHALDDGRPVATLVLACLRRTQQQTTGSAADADAQAHAADPLDSPRALWAAQGVAVNELARPALTLNLPTDTPGAGLPAGGEPRYWSLRQLLRSPPAWKAGGCDVFVCENPNLLALAADALGPRCAPLVCTDGMPAAAQRALLQQLAAAGARLHYHGDFDWPGIAIANRVLQDFGAVPWQMSAGDYGAAVVLAEASPQARLQGQPVAACWDPELEVCMRQLQIAVAEEAVAERLLPDLSLR